MRSAVAPLFFMPDDPTILSFSESLLALGFGSFLAYAFFKFFRELFR